MKIITKKKLTADNCKSASNILTPGVQDYLSLTEKNFAKDVIKIDAQDKKILVWEGSPDITEYIVIIATKIWFQKY